MSETPFVFEATRDDFDERVLRRSATVPVLVDFWAAWCAPCRILMPLLQGLAEEYQGRFLLAKVNSDAQQELALEYGVRSLPTVKVFRHGRVVEEFVGVQPESVIRDVIERHMERPAERLRTQARAALARGDLDGAQALLEEARAADPDDPDVILDLAELALRREDPGTAEALIGTLPFASRESDAAKTLLGRARFVRAVQGAPDSASLEAHLREHPDDLEARYRLAARRILAGDLAGGMDELLEIVRRDRGFRDGSAREGLLTVFEMAREDSELVNRYRRALSRLLY